MYATEALRYIKRTIDLINTVIYPNTNRKHLPITQCTRHIGEPITHVFCNEVEIGRFRATHLEIDVSIAIPTAPKYLTGTTKNRVLKVNHKRFIILRSLNKLNINRNMVRKLYGVDVLALPTRDKLTNSSILEYKRKAVVRVIFNSILDDLTLFNELTLKHHRVDYSPIKHYEMGDRLYAEVTRRLKDQQCR